MLTLSRAAIGLALLAALAGCRAKQDNTSENERAQLETAATAEAEIRQINSAATLLGIQLYPGSKPSQTREAYQFRENIDGRRYWLLLTTKDSIDSVVAHFKTNAGLMERRTGTKVQLEGKTPVGASITIDFGKDGLGMTEYMVIGTLSNSAVSEPEVTGTSEPAATEKPEPVAPAPPTEAPPIGGSGRIEPDYVEPPEGESPPDNGMAPPVENVPPPPGEGN